jgi:hypothetical protein
MIVSQTPPEADNEAQQQHARRGEKRHGHNDIAQLVHDEQVVILLDGVHESAGDGLAHAALARGVGAPTRDIKIDCVIPIEAPEEREQGYDRLRAQGLHRDCYTTQKRLRQEMLDKALRGESKILL